MPIKEESFRIGCGRYLQGAGHVKKAGDEVLRLGSAPLIIGGETALCIARERLEKSISEKCNKYEFIVHTGTCNEDDAKRLAELAHERGYDVIVGVGGGVICDFAKLCAYHARLPLLNIPTSSATCAAYTPLSVRYTADGRTVGSIHYSYEVNAVLVDTEIIATQPIRLFLAGVFDALAKFVEIKQRYNEEVTDYPLGLDYAYVLSKYSFDLLQGNMQRCIDDLKSGKVSEALERVIYTTIAATGVISGVARGSNQTAIAHKFYETTRSLFYKNTRGFTHGELVGVGLLIQNHFNGEVENNDILLRLMRKYGLPSSIEELNIEKTDDAFEAYFNAICKSSAIESDEEAERFRESLKYLWKLENAAKETGFGEYIKPERIFGNLYFIGTRAVCTHLIDTGDGLIIIDPGCSEGLPIILENIRALGFEPANIKYIIATHAHYDHMDSVSDLAAMTGAKTFIGGGDLPLLTGEAYHYPIKSFNPDVLLSDGDVISLGNTEIHCLSTPGHTDGTTSFFFDVTDGECTYRAGLFGGAGRNTLRRGFMAKHGIPEENRQKMLNSISRLMGERVEIFLGNHLTDNDTENKLNVIRSGGENPFLKNGQREWNAYLAKRLAMIEKMIGNDV